MMLLLRGYRVKSVLNERWQKGWRCKVVYTIDSNDDTKHMPERYEIEVTGKRRPFVWLRALFSARRDARARLR